MSSINSLLRTPFSQAILLGKVIEPVIVPSTYTATTTTTGAMSQPFKSTGVTGVPDINPKELYALVKEQKSNHLFNKAWKKLVSLLVPTKHQSKDLERFSKNHKDFFYLAIKLTFFSLLGRKNLSLKFRTSGDITEVNATFDEPSTDFPTEGENVYINHKIVNIIHNKKTNVAVKSEITGTSYLGVYVWNCGEIHKNQQEPQMILVHTSKIATNTDKTDWFTHSHSNLYYRPGNFKGLLQVIDSKNKTVDVTRYKKPSDTTSTTTTSTTTTGTTTTGTTTTTTTGTTTTGTTTTPATPIKVKKGPRQIPATPKKAKRVKQVAPITPITPIAPCNLDE